MKPRIGNAEMPHASFLIHQASAQGANSPLWGVSEKGKDAVMESQGIFQIHPRRKLIVTLTYDSLVRRIYIQITRPLSDMSNLLF